VSGLPAVPGSTPTSCKPALGQSCHVLSRLSIFKSLSRSVGPDFQSTTAGERRLYVLGSAPGELSWSASNPPVWFTYVAVNPDDPNCSSRCDPRVSNTIVCAIQQHTFRHRRIRMTGCLNQPVTANLRIRREYSGAPFSMRVIGRW
jgi:hypothetical protein